tara:strand:+ start:900 stop:1304 length:405 start_codon:yes stop_codon:yes gene_type:complete
MNRKIIRPDNYDYTKEEYSKYNKKAMLNFNILNLYLKKIPYTVIAKTLKTSIPTVSMVLKDYYQKKLKSKQEKEKRIDILKYGDFHFTESTINNIERKVHGLAEMVNKQPWNFYLRELYEKEKSLYSSFLMNQK